MNFKSDFQVALQGGQNYAALMELLGRYRVQGLSIDAAYEALHEIWLEYGFDKKEVEEGSFQNTLETVMEKVWYGCPV